MILADKYLFFLHVPGQGRQQVWPVNDQLEWKWERVKDEICLYRHSLETKLVLRNNDHATFDTLYTIERDRSACKEIRIEIAKRCHGEVEFQFYWEGLLALVDGEWDISRCKVEIKPRPNDALSCLFRNWTNTKNLLDIPNKQNVNAFYGGLEFLTCDNPKTQTGTGGIVVECPIYEFSECADPAIGWTPIKKVHTKQYGAFNLCPAESMETTYAREVTYSASGEPPGGGWINLGALNLWARSIPVSAPSTNFETIEIGQQTTYITTTTWDVASLSVDNGITISDAVYFLLSDCSYDIKSDFFGINSDGTAPANLAYQYASDYLQNLIMLQSSDVVVANAFQNATIGELSFKDLWKDIREMFNLCLILEDSTTLRIEHISYLAGRRILNLTNEPFWACLEGNWKYTYDKEELPQKNTFAWKNTSDKTGDWDGAYFEYPDLCTNDNEETKEIETKIKRIDTNVAYFYNNEEAEREEGFFLVATLSVDSNYNIILHEIGAISNAYAMNAPLSWANLIESLHVYRRPTASGIMNGKETIFQTLKRTKQQVELTIPFCCQDIREFDPTDLVKTQLGLGELTDATYLDPGESLVLNLLHN